MYRFSKLLRYVFILLFLPLSGTVFAQNANRIDTLNFQLDQVSSTFPGLNKKVELSVSGVTLQEFFRAIAVSNKINLSVDPSLTLKVTQNFSDIRAKDVILFLCKQYDLDLDLSGNVIFVKPYVAYIKPRNYTEELSSKIKVTDIGKKVGFDLKNDSLSVVAKYLSTVTGKTILIMPTVSSNLLSGYISENEFEKALENLALVNGLVTEKTDEGYFIFDKIAELKPVTQNSTLSTKLKSKKKSANEGWKIYGSKDSIYSAIFTELEVASVLDRLTEDSIAKFQYLDIPTGKVSLSVKDISINEFLVLLFQGSNYSFKSQPNGYLVGPNTSPLLKTYHFVRLKYRTLDNIAEAVPGYIKDGLEIKAFPELNGLVLSGPIQTILSAEKFINQLDKLVPVILIEVIIVDVDNSWAVSTGIEAGIGATPEQTRGQVFPATDITLSSNSINNLISSISGFGSINIGKVTPNFYLKLKAMEEQGYIHIRSTPKLSTINGHEASMKIGTKEYYLEITNNVIGSQNPQNIITQQYKPVEANLAVTINPIVSDSNQITLDINVEQSSFTNRISQTAPPGTITRTFKSLVRVANNDMVILGGLQENKTSETGKGVPILSRIPIIKWFFSSRSKSKEKSKLTIFVRPTVVF
jgi:type IV pilus assembly protein PilQ